MNLSRKRYNIYLSVEIYLKDSEDIQHIRVQNNGFMMEENLKLSKEDTSHLIDAKKYQMIVGSLMFLTNTRFDINFSIRVLSRFSNKLRESLENKNESTQVFERYIGVSHHI